MFYKKCILGDKIFMLNHIINPLLHLQLCLCSLSGKSGGFKISKLSNATCLGDNIAKALISKRERKCSGKLHLSQNSNVHRWGVARRRPYNNLVIRFKNKTRLSVHNKTILDAKGEGLRDLPLLALCSRVVKRPVHIYPYGRGRDLKTAGLNDNILQSSILRIRVIARSINLSRYCYGLLLFKVVNAWNIENIVLLKLNVLRGARQKPFNIYRDNLHSLVGITPVKHSPVKEGIVHKAAGHLYKPLNGRGLICELKDSRAVERTFYLYLIGIELHT